jgi:hypothetical protein
MPLLHAIVEIDGTSDVLGWIAVTVMYSSKTVIKEIAPKKTYETGL